MTEPITKAGKRVVVALAADHEIPDADIVEIEQQAMDIMRKSIRKGVEQVPSGCHSHSGLNCEKDAYGWCYLIDRSAVLELL